MRFRALRERNGKRTRPVMTGIVQKAVDRKLCAWRKGSIRLPNHKLNLAGSSKPTKIARAMPSTLTTVQQDLPVSWRISRSLIPLPSMYDCGAKGLSRRRPHLSVSRLRSLLRRCLRFQHRFLLSRQDLLRLMQPCSPLTLAKLPSPPFQCHLRAVRFRHQTPTSHPLPRRIDL